MDGREGGREGSRERQRHVAPLPRLLQCLDNIMLCVHLHKYWGWVFRRKRNRRSVKNALIKIVKIISSSFLILSKYLFSKYGYEFDQRIWCIPCGLLWCGSCWTPPLDVGAVKRGSLGHNSLETHHTHSNKIECRLGQFFNWGGRSI